MQRAPRSLAPDVKFDPLAGLGQTHVGRQVAGQVNRLAVDSQLPAEHIPGWIVQGRFDVVTPMETAWKLKEAWPAARFNLVWDAGHASTEPGIVDALVRATDQALGV